MDLLSDEFKTEEIRPLAEARVRIITEKLIEEQKAWPHVTDCDKIDSVFFALGQKGIVCRQDFSCCGSCRSGEIWDEINKESKAGQLVRGYAFYHMQDTESAVEGGGIYLNYGVTEEGELAALRIAHEICDEIRLSGLEVDWDGSWEKRIGVMLEWKRRRRATRTK